MKYLAIICHEHNIRINFENVLFMEAYIVENYVKILVMNKNRSFFVYNTISDFLEIRQSVCKLFPDKIIIKGNSKFELSLDDSV